MYVNLRGLISHMLELNDNTSTVFFKRRRLSVNFFDE